MKMPTIVLAAITFILVSCNATTKTAPQSVVQKTDFEMSITQKYWKLLELNGRRVVMSKEQSREPHFILKSENILTGHSGCNSFNGNYEVTGSSKISFSKMISTKMACIDVPYENEYLKVFEDVDTYTLKGDTLFFNNLKGDTIAKFQVVYFK
jgi:heat shock protein HslJ